MASAIRSGGRFPSSPCFPRRSEPRYADHRVKTANSRSISSEDWSHCRVYCRGTWPSPSLSHLLVFFCPFFLLFHHFLVPDTRHKLEETRQDLTSDPDDQLLLYLRPGKSRIKLARSRREEAGETTPNGVLPTVIRKMMLRDASSFFHLEKGIL